MKKLILFFLTFFHLQCVTGQQNLRREYGKMAVLSGLHQPLVLHGSNLAFNYFGKNGFILESSFGIALDYKKVLTKEEKHRYKSVKTPFSYGFGIGYFYKGFSFNFEPKGTMFRVQDYGGKTVNYTTWSLGAGIYHNVFLSHNFFLQPSIRYWQKVGSTLKQNEVLLRDMNSETFSHSARKPGKEGWIYGVSAGWLFL